MQAKSAWWPIKRGIAVIAKLIDYFYHYFGAGLQGAVASLGEGSYSVETIPLRS